MPKLIVRGFFVVCLLFLVVVCWKLLTASQHQHPAVPYAIFVQALDAGKIQETYLKFVGKDSSEEEVRDVSTKDLPSLIKR
jgi:hypothetical protein